MSATFLTPTEQRIFRRLGGMGVTVLSAAAIKRRAAHGPKPRPPREEPASAPRSKRKPKSGSPGQVLTSAEVRDLDYSGRTGELRFQAEVEEIATRGGWLFFHDGYSRRSEAGFPDLVLVGYGRVLFRELKTATGRVSPEQARWIAQLTAAGADVAVWRPRDLEEIERELIGARNAAVMAARRGTK